MTITKQMHKCFRRRLAKSTVIWYF